MWSRLSTYRGLTISLYLCLSLCRLSFAGGLYSLSNSWEHARERLAYLENYSNPYTFEILEKADIQSGWHCLDAGAGLGGITRWLAEKVGVEGSVDALDIEPHFLREIPDSNVNVLEQDLVTDDLPEATYDFIFARNVLMHIPERKQVIEKFVHALKPGGLLITEDSARLPLDASIPDLSKDSAMNTMMHSILASLEQATNISFLSAYESPKYFVKTGLVNVTGSASAYFPASSTDMAHMLLNFKQLKPVFIQAGYDESVYDRFGSNH